MKKIILGLCLLASHSFGSSVDDFLHKTRISDENYYDFEKLSHSESPCKALFKSLGREHKLD